MKLVTNLKKITDKEFPIQWHHLLFFVLIVAFTPTSGFWFDLQDWTRWSVYTFEHGLSRIYESDTNYMPFYLHLLYFFGKIQGSVANIQANIHQIKYFFLIFDFGAALALAHAYKRFHGNPMASYMLLFNVAYLYETVLWGQLDSVPTTLVILAFVCLLNNRLLWAVFFCTLSIHAKLQAIVFVPFYVLVLVYQLKQNQFNFKLLIKAFFVFLAVNLWMLAPFIYSRTIKNFLQVVVESVGFFPRVSWYAFNIWHLLLSADPKEIYDSEPFLRLTYKKWGFLMFFFFSGISLLPITLVTWKNLLQNKILSKTYLELFWLTAGTIAVVFFFFNTQMHERYCFPALVMYFGYGLISRNYALYALVSMAHLMNIDSFYKALKIPYISPEFVASLYVVILFISFYRIYQLWRNEKSNV